MKDTIDLIPREFARRRHAQARIAAWSVVGVAALAAVLFSAISLALRARTVEAAVAPLRDRVAELRAVHAQVPPLAATLRDRLARQQFVAQLLVEPRWNDVLHDLSNAITGEVWVESLQLEQSLATGGQAPPALPEILVRGTASSDRALLQFMNDFSESPWLESLMLQQSRLDAGADEEEGSLVHFVLQGVLNSDRRQD